MSAGELEHEWAGTPGRLIRCSFLHRTDQPATGYWQVCEVPFQIADQRCQLNDRERYRKAAEMSRTRGKFSCLLINDIDAGIGHFKDTQVTVNNQVSADPWLTEQRVLY